MKTSNDFNMDSESLLTNAQFSENVALVYIRGQLKFYFKIQTQCNTRLQM